MPMTGTAPVDEINRRVTIMLRVKTQNETEF
jgi:hypothetical protein